MLMGKIRGLNKESLCVFVRARVWGYGIWGGVLISSNKTYSNIQHNDTATNRQRH